MAVSDLFQFKPHPVESCLLFGGGGKVFSPPWRMAADLLLDLDGWMDNNIIMQEKNTSNKSVCTARLVFVCNVLLNSYISFAEISPCRDGRMSQSDS